jgi:alpha-amylase/alpha-mannosidase (GH57 family)
MERRAFTEDDIRDLQVWHKLAWMDPDLLHADERLIGLVTKGAAFTEDDKQLLREVELELLGRVIPAYRAAAASGHVELATSPFYHPILPLLCDSDIHRDTHPGAAGPRQRFRRPGDARLQIDRAVAFHQQMFGERPAGMWPSEGSVSNEAVGLIADAGFAWIATDEDILARSLHAAATPDVLYRPYRLGDAGPIVLFRDHALSDRIGFHYQSWDAEAAAADFVERLREAGRRFSDATGGEAATIPVILDGENAWEYFDAGGRPFLRALYRALDAAEDIETVTMSEAAAGEARTLPSIYPGSWINGDFYIWIGHRDDHRAWDQLSDARRAFDERSGSVSPDAAARALEELLIAEGSDWFWWYGDDHSSDHDADFDDLFRRHLRNAYSALGAAIPEDLFATNISTGAGPDRLEPSGLITVSLDGRDSSFLEWVGAVSPSLARPGGAMHEVTASALITDIRVGLSADALCVRLTGSGLTASLAAGQVSLVLVIASGDVRILAIERSWLAVDALVEVRVPFDRIAVPPGSDLQFAIQVQDAAGAILESVPHGRFWTICIPGSASARRDWQA